MKKLVIYAVLALSVFACRKETVSTVLTGPAGAADKLQVGESAKGLLRADTYQNLNIEIQYAPDMKPQDQSINNLVSFLNTYLNKPGGITVSLKQAPSIGKATVTTPDVVSFTDNNRTLYTDGNHIDIYIYFADADYTQNGVIGFAFRNTAIVVFEKTVQTHSGGVNQVDRIKVESGVLEHEAGHILGLVNSGTPMVTNHEDPSNQAHCNNQHCLMYYAIETSGLLNMLNNSVPALDTNCINDLKANGGK